MLMSETLMARSHDDNDWRGDIQNDDGVFKLQEKPPFDDIKVREAFAMAYDRDAWVADVLKGLGSPTLTWIPPGFPGYQEGETRWGYDAEAAKQAIDGMNLQPIAGRNVTVNEARPKPSRGDRRSRP